MQFIFKELSSTECFKKIYNKATFPRSVFLPTAACLTQSTEVPDQVGLVQTERERGVGEKFICSDVTLFNKLAMVMFKNISTSHACWYIPLISALKRQRQVDL